MYFFQIPVRTCKLAWKIEDRPQPNKPYKRKRRTPYRRNRNRIAARSNMLFVSFYAPIVLYKTKKTKTAKRLKRFLLRSRVILNIMIHARERPYPPKVDGYFNEYHRTIVPRLSGKSLYSQKEKKTFVFVRFFVFFSLSPFRSFTAEFIDNNVVIDPERTTLATSVA